MQLTVWKCLYKVLKTYWEFLTRFTSDLFISFVQITGFGFNIPLKIREIFESLSEATCHMLIKFNLTQELDIM